MESIIAGITVGLTTIPVLETMLWDGSSWGMVGTIVDNAPKRDRGLVHPCFSRMDPIGLIIPELLAKSEKSPRMFVGTNPSSDHGYSKANFGGLVIFTFLGPLAAALLWTVCPVLQVRD